MAPVCILVHGERVGWLAVMMHMGTVGCLYGSVPLVSRWRGFTLPSYCVTVTNVLEFKITKMLIKKKIRKIVLFFTLFSTWIKGS